MTIARCIVVSLLAANLATCSVAQAAVQTVAKSAAAIDKMLAAEVANKNNGPLVAEADDATFLRRASLDTIGRNPTPEEIAAFALDPAQDKRSRVVKRLLANERFGQNWARYWRDVIFARRLDDRSLVANTALVVHLTNSFNANKPWDEIVRDFITAKGDVQQNGATALIFAQNGQAVETAAEVSRIFLGVQIQCAQCHDHKTDRWRREQFHELAAFFPRMRVQRVANPLVRSLEVTSVDRGRGAGPKKPGRGSLEHYMPDLDDPKAKGTLMTPTFFVSATKAKLGMTDDERREQLAEWLTADENPWFARALVNRVWAELVGEGFYEPIDDMGPDRKASAPKTLDFLAKQFVAAGHDVKWLVATIMSTETYGRETRARRKPTQRPFAANCTQPLRSDTLFSSLVTALGIEEPQAGRGKGGYRAGPRQQFGLAFGFDPSLPRDEVSSTIPQALFLMNSPQLNQTINARRTNTVLGRLVREIEDDEKLIAELYLRCLARQPNAKEIKVCLEYIKKADDRGHAFEDLVWSLINSTEFRHRK